MEKVAKRIEIVANILIIIVAIAITVVLVKRFVLSPAQPPPRGNIAIGSRVSLPDVDWARNQRTLVLVLSTTCKFCTESAPFYQRLTDARKNTNHFRLLALFRQPPEDARKYLDSLGVTVDEIKEGSLTSIGVEATPTLLFVDGSGTLKSAWVGKLPPEKENEVLKSMF